MDWNPSHHMRHAWTDASTIWGKIALVLFYGLIWVMIIKAAWSLFSPASSGGQCFLDMASSKSHEIAIAFIRACNVLFIGFFSYADVSGLKVKNVVLVCLVLIGYVMSFYPLTEMMNDPESGCDSVWVQMWFLPGWAILALVFTLLEDKLGDHGSQEERAPLTV